MNAVLYSKSVPVLFLPTLVAVAGYPTISRLPWTTQNAALPSWPAAQPKRGSSPQATSSLSPLGTFPSSTFTFLWQVECAAVESGAALGLQPQLQVPVPPDLIGDFICVIQQIDTEDRAF